MDRILLVDDEVFILRALERLLRRVGYDVYTAQSAMQALDVLAVTPCQVVISDYRMPAMNGEQLLREIKRHYPNMVCLILSGFADFNAVISLLNAGVAFRFLQKPWDDSALLSEVDAAFRLYKNVRAEQVRSQFLLSCADPLVELTAQGTFARSNAAFQQTCKLAAAEITGSRIADIFNEVSDTTLETFLTHSGSVLPVRRYGREFELVVQKADHDITLLKLQFVDELPPLLGSTVNLPMVLNQSELVTEADNLLVAKVPFALVALQIRDFNLMADIIGIHEAEQVLDAVAAALLASVQRCGKLAYLANEQFAIIVPQVVSEPWLHQQILAILQQVDSQQLVKGKLVQLGFTVAYCIAPADGHTGKMLLNNALLTSRLNSKGRLDFFMRYSASLTASRKQQMQLSEALYHAIDNNELSLVFQPKWQLDTLQVTGAEVLLRWQSKVFGNVSPAVFIAIAEQDGQINELGNWVLKRACQYLADWQKAGISLLPLAVNVSVLQLQTHRFISTTLSALQQATITPALLQLELTESAIMSDLAASTQHLTALKAAGFSLAIDDFGTGYSSLAYLTQLPADTLKIDKSLIDDIEGNLSTQTMLHNIVRMAHDLGQKIVVEGVETAEQLQILQQLQCDEAQGFYLSRPLAEADYLALIMPPPDTE